MSRFHTARLTFLEGVCVSCYFGRKNKERLFELVGDTITKEKVELHQARCIKCNRINYVPFLDVTTLTMIN